MTPTQNPTGNERMVPVALNTSHLTALIELEAHAASGMSAEQLALALADPQAVVLGIGREPDAATSLLGYAWLARQPFDAELLALGVAPGARRLGLGRRLLEAVVETAIAWGSERLLLEVRASNIAAIALYRQGGLGADGRRKGYYPPALPQTAREDALLMSRRLRRVGD